DAIDVIVRSLRAGHPVPVAIAMVAREMPDPVGTEFGMVADEITYGADIETAMRAMMARVGQEDLPLFVTSISIQATTGGNLSQILDNLSKVIRERFKMRRKIKGLSAEGRAGAMILNIVPFAVFALVNVISPDFYGAIWHKPSTKYVLAGAMFWMFVGNMIMRRMVNFKI
ncbi:MAG TPA: type II secretion system F family protein, partial [Microvirga sp.]|nr:type II secretion system F family protein [Microvirga sp.]